MAKIPEGCILLARKIRDSEIWYNKPSWWLKVWCYILMQVNHKDNKDFKRGQNFFSYLQIFNDCKLNIDRVKAKSVDNVVRWLRATTQITTKLTTRGIVITVCNYELYQNLNSYKNDNTKDIVNDDGTTTERRRNDTINKNDKNVENEKNGNIKEIYKEKFSFFEDKAFTKRFQDYLDMRKEKKKPATDVAKELVLKFLHEHDIKTAIAMIEASIKNSWTDVYKLKDKQKGGQYGQASRRHTEKHTAGKVIE